MTLMKLKFGCSIWIVRLDVIFLTLTHDAIGQMIEFLEAEVLMRLTFELLVMN